MPCPSTRTDARVTQSQSSRGVQADHRQSDCEHERQEEPRGGGEGVERPAQPRFAHGDGTNQRARFSGTPSSVTAASSARPTPLRAPDANDLALLRSGLAADVAVQGCVDGDERCGPREEPEPGAHRTAHRERFLEQLKCQRRDERAAAHASST